MKRVAAALAAVLAVTAGLPVEAQRGFSGRTGGGVERRDYDVKATGLSAVFPDGFACDAIASAYGSPERHDGSTRLQARNSGLHGGMDISLKEGTPLSAMAAGNVVAKGEGGALEGFHLWLQHAPADTGLPFWAIAKYQHLRELPNVDVGERVAIGQVVALSGMTGTAGPAFGPGGYPHLHISLFVATGPAAGDGGATQARMPPANGRLSDPLLMFLSPGTDADRAAALPAESRRLSVAIADASGNIVPAGSRVIWPTRCAVGEVR